MRWLRFFLFLLSIALGVGAGVAYGWGFNPPDYRDLTPSSLHAYYKADYVLMVAEIYGQEGNLPQALRRLSHLEPNLPPARSVAEALLTARDQQYDPADLELMAKLAQAVQSAPTSETLVPGTPAPVSETQAPGAPTPTSTGEAQP